MSSSSSSKQTTKKSTKPLKKEEDNNDDDNNNKKIIESDKFKTFHTRLQEQMSEEKHQAVIRTCDQMILQLTMNSNNQISSSSSSSSSSSLSLYQNTMIEIARGKCIALLHLNRNAECENYIIYISKNYGKYLQEHLIFYHVYSLYKQNKNRDVSSIFTDFDTNRSQLIQSLPLKEKEGLNHLRCQFQYRLGQYDKSYEHIKKARTKDPTNIDLKTNAISTLISFSKANTAVTEYFQKETTKSYTCDYILNLSLALIASNRVKEAQQLISTSYKKCEESMRDTEDLNEEEIASEMAGLNILHGICYHLLGDEANAKSMYQKLRQSKDVNDKSMKGILNNNLYLLDPTLYNLHQSLEIYNWLFSKEHQRVDPMLHFDRLGENNENEVTQEMKLKAINNKVYYLLHAKQFNQAKQVLNHMKQLISEWSKSEILIKLEVAYNIALGDYNKAITILSKYVTEVTQAKKKCSIQIIETLLQLLVKMNRFKEAIKIIRANDHIFTKTDLIPKILHIARVDGDQNLLNELIEKCLQMEQSKVSLPKEMILDLKLAKCQSLLLKGDAQEASKFLASLNEKGTLKVKAMNAIVAANLSKLEESEKIASQLPSLQAQDSALVDTIPVPKFLRQETDLKKRSFDLDRNQFKKFGQQMNRKVRRRNALKYKDSSKPPVNWTAKEENIKKRKRFQRRKQKAAEEANKNNEKKGATEQKPKKTQKRKNQKKNQSEKKKRSNVSGAQGATSGEDKYRVYDKETEKKQGKFGAKNLPSHIKPRRK